VMNADGPSGRRLLPCYDPQTAARAAVLLEEI
jgi:hypothetical protein